MKLKRVARNVQPGDMVVLWGDQWRHPRPGQRLRAGRYGVYQNVISQTLLTTNGIVSVGVPAGVVLYGFAKVNVK